MDAAQPAAQRATALLGAMSLADKIQMVTGGGEFNPQGPNPPAASYIAANPALCIPALVMNDATAGVGDEQQLTTAFPDSIALAAAWDPSLAQRYGAVLGGEAFAKGVNVLLGPGVDIARNPLNGRNFEYAGEDPYLAGQAAAGVVQGIQSQHVIATVKHYALNDQETNRMTDSSDADERTMQEIDLPAFDAAVKAGVGSVMCSYNRVNSVYACENPYLLHSVLDDQFAFSGFVMSDWGANHSTVASANAGLDMEMPGGVGTSPEFCGPALQTAVQDGQVSTAVLNSMVHRILYTMFRLGLFDHVPAEGAQAAATPATNSDSLAMATSVAEEGTVLLKNAGGVLPLSGPAKRIAVIGPAANEAGATLAEQGYGSGHVPMFSYQPGVVSPLQSITARAAQAGDVVTYADGESTADAVAAASAADVAVLFDNDAEIEGADRPDLNAHAGTCSFLDFASSTSCSYSPLDQNALVSAVAAANPHTIVVIQSGGPIAMPWAGQVQGILENWFPGQVDGNAIAPILFGDVDPSGKLPGDLPGQPVRRPAPDRGPVSGSERARRHRGAALELQRGSARRVPLVRRQGHRAALPVRLRAVLHHVQVFRDRCAAQRQRGVGWLYRDEHRHSGRVGRRSGLRRRPCRGRGTPQATQGISAREPGARSERDAHDPTGRDVIRALGRVAPRVDGERRHLPGDGGKLLARDRRPGVGGAAGEPVRRLRTGYARPRARRVL